MSKHHTIRRLGAIDHTSGRERSSPPGPDLRVPSRARHLSLRRVHAFPAGGVHVSRPEHVPGCGLLPSGGHVRAAQGAAEVGGRPMPATAEDAGARAGPPLPYAVTANQGTTATRVMNGASRARPGLTCRDANHTEWAPCLTHGPVHRRPSCVTTAWPASRQRTLCSPADAAASPQARDGPAPLPRTDRAGLLAPSLERTFVRRLPCWSRHEERGNSGIWTSFECQ